jgi:hypothetical protein
VSALRYFPSASPNQAMGDLTTATDGMASHDVRLFRTSPDGRGGSSVLGIGAFSVVAGACRGRYGASSFRGRWTCQSHMRLSTKPEHVAPPCAHQKTCADIPASCLEPRRQRAVRLRGRRLRSIDQVGTPSTRRSTLRYSSVNSGAGSITTSRGKGDKRAGSHTLQNRKHRHL